MFNLFGFNVLGRKNRILGTFNKVIKDLEKLMQDTYIKVDKKIAKAAALEDRAQDIRDDGANALEELNGVSDTLIKLRALVK